MDAPSYYIPKPGDLITTCGTGFVSGMINVGTWSLPGLGASHVGIVADVQGHRVVVESTSLAPEPCLVAGEKVSGVQVHTLRQMADRPGRAWVHPLHRPLYTHESDRLTLYLLSRLGTPYDMIGAGRSGGVLFSFLQSWLREEDFTRLFCSELCASAIDHIGVEAFRNASTWSPNKLVRRTRFRGLYQARIRLEAERFSSRLPEIEVSTRR